MCVPNYFIISHCRTPPCGHLLDRLLFQHTSLSVLVCVCCVQNDVCVCPFVLHYCAGISPDLEIGVFLSDEVTRNILASQKFSEAFCLFV